MTGRQPLDGIRVLDFSTQLPGPLATTILARAGAEVVKIERPGRGDELRHQGSRVGEAGAAFHLLNHDKTILTADLKDAEHRDCVQRIATNAHVVIEQFRPGVADRLGVGYRELSDLNPTLVYCSITGYGQASAQRLRAGHDLTYLADSGLLYLTTADGTPAIPPGAMADVAGGTYPAVTAILLALHRVQHSRVGEHIDISMTHALEPFTYAALAERRASGLWPQPNSGTYNGGDPRYGVYPTNDGRHVAVAAVDEPFWTNLVRLLDLPIDPHIASTASNHAEIEDHLARAIGAHSAATWAETFDQNDVCCRVVATPEEAEQAGLLNAYGTSDDGCTIGDLRTGAGDARMASRRCTVGESPAEVPKSADVWSRVPAHDSLCRVRYETRLTLSDTDSTGTWQFDAVLRLVQAAEIELLRDQGVLDELGANCPRVYVEVDYRRPAHFDSRLVVDLGLVRLGNTSLHYEFTVYSDGKVAAHGKLGAAYVVDGASHHLPGTARSRLTSRAGEPQASP